MKKNSFFSAFDMVSPFLVFLFLFFVTLYVYRKNKDEYSYYKYFVLSFCLKLVGLTATILMYGFYYNGGDTYMYYKISSQLYNNFIDSPLTIFENLWLETGNSDKSLRVRNIVYFFSIFTQNSYIAISLCVTYLSVIGGWLIYVVFIDLYPKFKKQLAICVLFIPSIWFWSTGILKEPLAIFGLGVLFYTFYQILFKKKFKWVYFIMLLTGYLTLMVKPYMFYMLILFFAIWYSAHRAAQFKSKILKFIGGVTIVLVGIIGMIYLSRTSLLTNILLEESGVLTEAISKSTYLEKKTTTNDGSGYSLGPMDYSINGVLSKFFPAINVTLFRPYIWESKKVINLPAAIESLGLLLFFLYVLIRVRVWGSIVVLVRNPFLLATFIYCILFSFIVGFTAMNFGALARFKLPVVTFVYALIFLILIEFKKYRSNRSLK